MWRVYVRASSPLAMDAACKVGLYKSDVAVQTSRYITLPIVDVDGGGDGAVYIVLANTPLCGVLVVNSSNPAAVVLAHAPVCY